VCLRRGKIPDATNHDDAKRKFRTIAANVRNGRPALDGFTKPRRPDDRTAGEWLAQPRDPRGRDDTLDRVCLPHAPAAAKGVEAPQIRGAMMRIVQGADHGLLPHDDCPALEMMALA